MRKLVIAVCLLGALVFSASASATQSAPSRTSHAKPMIVKMLPINEYRLKLRH